MARLVKPLTATQIANAKPRQSMYKMFDGGGLFLQINPSGGKHWKMKYRKDDGKEALLSFGKFPEVSLEQARKKRDEARSLKAEGHDPGEVKRRQKAEKVERAKNTFEAVARAWMEIHATKVKPQTMDYMRQLLENSILPLIGKSPVKNLKAPDFLDVLRRIEAQGHLCTSKKAKSVCSMVMCFAVAEGLADVDPIPSLRYSLKAYKKGHYAAMTEPKEVGRLLRSIWAYTGTYVVSSAMRMAPYVFVRPGELRQARWADIDLEACEWRYIVPKTETPHIVPLAPQVMAILKDLYPLTGKDEYVFPSLRQNNRPINRGTLVAALRCMGIGTDEMTTHGFRAIARTLLDEVLGERYDLIEHQLAHVVRDPNGRAYNRTQHLSERRRMMERWANYLDELRADVPVVA